MKVIKQFYTHKEKKTYNVGDDYQGKLFDNHEEYLDTKKRKTKK